MAKDPVNQLSFTVTKYLSTLTYCVKRFALAFSFGDFSLLSAYGDLIYEYEFCHAERSICLESVAVINVGGVGVTKLITLWLESELENNRNKFYKSCGHLIYLRLPHTRSLL